jgi:hypothetical protein
MNTTKEVKGELEWIIPKEKFLATETGRNFAEFYRQIIIGPHSDNQDVEYSAWLESFDFVRVRIYPDEERLCFALLTAYGRLQDEHCEDLFPEYLPEILRDLREAVRERPLAPHPLFSDPHFTSAAAQGPARPGA